MTPKSHASPPSVEAGKTPEPETPSRAAPKHSPRKRATTPSRPSSPKVGKEMPPEPAVGSPDRPDRP